MECPSHFSPQRVKLNEWFDPKIPFLILSVQSVLSKIKQNIELKSVEKRCNYNTKGRPKVDVSTVHTADAMIPQTSGQIRQ